MCKNLRIKYRQKLLDHAKKSATDVLKTTSKRAILKQQKQLMIWLVIKYLRPLLSRTTTKLRKSREFHHIIIQRRLQTSIIKKYLKKDIHLYINFLDQQVKNDQRIYNKIRQFTTGQGDDYTTGCYWIMFISKFVIRW